MNQSLDHAPPARLSEAGRWRALKTVALLAVGAFASLHLVDLPGRASGAVPGHARGYVPAAEKWIPLGSAEAAPGEAASAKAPAVSATGGSGVAAAPRQIRRHLHALPKARRGDASRKRAAAVKARAS